MKRIAIYIVAALVAIGFIWWLIGFLTTGHISITTSASNNTITLTKVVEGGSSSNYVKHAHNSLSLDLGTGRYVVSVQGNSVATTQTVTVKPHSNLQLTLNPIETTGVEPVSYRGALSLAADSSHLVYLDAYNMGIYKVSDQNTVTQAHPELHFKSFQWQNSTFGAGITSDGKLYLFNNGSLSEVTTPRSADTGSNILYAVAPNNELFISVGSYIYSKQGSSGFRQIYNEKNTFTSLAATSDKVAVINSPGDGGNKTKPYVTVVSDTGASFSKNIDIQAVASWAPDGQHLASVGSDGLAIFDDNLNSIATIPAPFTNGLSWITNTSLAYGGNGLWTYDLTTSRANLVANMPLNSGVSSVTTSDDKGYLYVTTLDGKNNLTIKRVGLHGQKVSKAIYQLQNILPIDTDGYSVSFLNFAHPTIVILQLPTSPPTYINDAETDLQQRGFDISNFQVISVLGESNVYE